MEANVDAAQQATEGATTEQQRKWRNHKVCSMEVILAQHFCLETAQLLDPEKPLQRQKPTQKV